MSARTVIMEAASHLAILPVVVPIAAAAILLFLPRDNLAAQRLVSIGAVVLTLLAAAGLMAEVWPGTITLYALGAWPPPFGIVLVVDRLAAVMVLLTALAALMAVLYASGGDDRLGPHFHVFLQFQVAGLAGAFLTGDIFNLFVFFEVLLIASYGLMTHGAGRERARAGLHYVGINLIGSALFLTALGLTYGTLGTLNMADMAGRLATLPEADRGLAAVAMTLLAVVFVLKAAVAPLGFWLPGTYGSTTPAVAALFAVLTKVGIYAVLRLDATILAMTTWTSGLLQGWLVPLALLTMGLAVLGLFQARRLMEAAGHLVLISSGTLLVAIGLGGEAMLRAVMLYLPHTVIATAGLFLVAGAIQQSRLRGDSFDRCQPIAPVPWLGAAYLFIAAAIAGLPPLSGFLAKWLVLWATPATAVGAWTVALLLATALASILVLVRAGSTIFWEPLHKEGPAAALPARLQPRTGLAIALAAALLVAFPLLSATLERGLSAVARQLAEPRLYAAAVLPPGTVIARERRGGAP